MSGSFVGDTFDFFDGQGQLQVVSDDEVTVSIATGENQFTVITVRAIWGPAPDGGIGIIADPRVQVVDRIQGGTSGTGEHRTVLDA